MSTPPTVAGVGASSVRLPPGSWPSLLAFLDQRFPDVGRAVWLARLADGKVSDAETGVLGVGAAYVAGRRIHYYRELPPEALIPFEAQILHRDAHLLVADKPHFLPTLPSGRFVQETLLTRLKRATGLDDLVPLHRLDRGTWSRGRGRRARRQPRDLGAGRARPHPQADARHPAGLATPERAAGAHGSRRPAAGR